MVWTRKGKIQKDVKLGPEGTTEKGKTIKKLKIDMNDTMSSRGLKDGA